MVPAVAIVVSIGVRSETGAPAIPPVSLSSDPLYATTSGDKPTLALALSVEWPTAGAQYFKGPNETTDDSYSNANEYIGYFDAESCYVYNNSPTETPLPGQTAADYKRFQRTGTATNRMCADAFSGNFLNWASGSAIDMLRLSLSGGDRYIDTPDLTILQRALVPNREPCLWNTTSFPGKQLMRNGAGAGAYWGAVPIAMRNAAGTNDIWVANTLNQIFFGTAKGGTCDATSGYTLGSPGLNRVGPVTYRTGSLPSDASPACATENGTCTFSGIKEIWYGAGTQWAVAPASESILCSAAAVFGDPAYGVYKACYTRNYSGTWTPPAAAAVLNTDGFFYARVQVCDQDAAGNLLDKRDYGVKHDFCARYPNGKHKPTGSIQRYSDKLRLAVFGYALDQTQSYAGGRYGGVLRAPMKYVGYKTFDVHGQENTPPGGNPAAEWDATTGIFASNPDNDKTQTPAISGVVNYLNKFGRTGVPGRYKSWDPVSELHYETLRYLQGLPPSPDAIKDLTPAMYDGFPIYKDWSALDPYANRSATSSYACLKSNIVVIGDIHTHDGSRFPAANEQQNIPDLPKWTAVVQNFERGSVSNYVDGQGNNRQTSNPNPPNANPRSEAIIGYSYWAHTHDIRGTNWTAEKDKQRPGLRANTFIFDVNAYGIQTDSNARRYNNQFFTAAKYGGFKSTRATGAANNQIYNTYGNPFKREDGSYDNDVWQDPANPGEAGTYFLQSSGRSVLAAFDKIFERVGERARSIAGAATRSANLTSGTANMIYQAAYDTTNWSGDVLAFNLAVDGNNKVSLSSTPQWSAADKLKSRSDLAATRNLVVGNTRAPGGSVASPFTWNAISADLQQALDKPDAQSVADGLGKKRVDFIRGDLSNDGTTFRNRDGQLLGDILNSGIAYSGEPSNVINSATYPEFRKTNLDRTPAVFVGANDGMLHAFNANSGEELFGYIPSWVAPRLSVLTSKTYIDNHQSYVDAAPVVAEAQVGNTGTGADWQTVLVGGTGAGGRGVYALDVTNPATFSASNVKWEFTVADDIDPEDSSNSYGLGHVVGRPQILKFRTSAPDKSPVYKWFAVVASGVNNYVPDSAGRFSASGKPALYLLDLAKAPGDAWEIRKNYFKISLPIDATPSTSKATGAINFKAALGLNQEVTKIFMGDLHGRLWKLNFKSFGQADWNIGKLSALNGVDSDARPYPLYVARDGSGNVQPITAAPMLVRGEGNSVYVAFGTGKYLEASDRSSKAQNSFYVVHDNGAKVADDTTTPIQIQGRGRLQAGTYKSGTGEIDVAPFVWGRPASDTDTTQRAGWYFDYPTTGERQVSGVALAGDTLIFSSLIPDSATSTSTCGPAGGSGFEYRANVDTGNAASSASTVGLLGESMVMRIESATTPAKTDSTGRRHPLRTTQSINQGVTGMAVGATVTTEEVAGRLSWRQVHNYRDLRNAK